MLMDNHFEMRIDALRQKLLTMASLAETAVNQSLQALLHRDYQLALQVKDSDQRIDQYEVEIDDLVIQIQDAGLHDLAAAEEQQLPGEIGGALGI